MASYSNSHGILKKAILTGGRVNAVDELGSTPLHLALLLGNMWMVKALLKYGGNPEAVDHKGSTPLHVGCCSENKEAVSVMIDHGRYGKMYCFLTWRSV